MKKTIFTILVMATVALVINKSQTKAELTELEKANVEALADVPPTVKSVCYNSIFTKAGSWARYCQNCTIIPGDGYEEDICIKRK